MQRVIIKWGIVSTCRGWGRQTRHPHSSIHLEDRRQEELGAHVQTSQHAWTLFPMFWVQHYSISRCDSPKKRLFLWHMLHLRLEKDHKMPLKAEWNLQRPRLQLDTWTNGHMKWVKYEWMKSTSTSKSMWNPLLDPWLGRLHSSLKLTSFKRGCG